VANLCTYYFEVPKTYHDGGDWVDAGVYVSEGYVGGLLGWQYRLFRNSDRAWIQGTKGGVRLKGKYDIFRYVTKNEQLMKEFMWIKLKAKEIKN
jgi:hypothetical protein